MVSFLLVLSNYAALHSLSFLLVAEAEEDKTEASAPIRKFLSHDDGIFNFTELLEVVEKVGLRCGEGKPTDEQLHLVLLGGLVETSRRSAIATNCVATRIAIVALTSAHVGATSPNVA